MLTQHLTAAALFIIMAVLSTADFANAINDRSSLRGRSSAIANGSIDIWGEEGPVACHQHQRQLSQFSTASCSAAYRKRKNRPLDR